MSFEKTICSISISSAIATSQNGFLCEKYKKHGAIVISEEDRNRNGVESHHFT